MNICRLCLKVSNEEMLKLSPESEIMHKISSCLILLIPIDEQLPNQVCTMCASKVEDVYHFWKCVKQNEDLLTEHLKLEKCDLKMLYFKNKQNYKNNIETFDGTNKSTIHNIKSNNSLNINKGSLDPSHDTLDSKEVTIKSKVDVFLKDSISYKDTENKSEDNCIEQTDSYSSEDEIVLSSLKEPKNSSQLENNVLNGNTESTIIVPQGNNLNFKCLSCFELHQSYEHLQQHYITVHSHRKKRKIDSSSYTTQKTGATSVEYNCATCNKVYIDKRSIITHVLAHTEQPEDRQFTCKICGRTFRSVGEILRHGRAHGGAAPLACRYACGFSTGYAHSLRDHEKRHRRDYKYVCGTCGRGFLTRTWFEQHQNVHSGVRPYRCDLCPKAFHMHKFILHIEPV